jgi:hypothetical protein
MVPSTASFDVQFAYVWNVPRSCFFDLTCAEIEQAFNMATSTDGSTVMFDASCLEASDLCRCDVQGFIAGTATGTYTTSGSTLTMFSTDSESGMEYCVGGNNLTLRAEGGGYVLTRN